MPAMLKVLDGEPKVMLQAAASLQTLAKGMCLLPKSAISQWISSEMTTIPLLKQNCASFSSVCLSQTMPAGLCGLDRMSSLHLLSQTWARLSKSIE